MPVLSLDDCRSMALANNAAMRNATLSVRAAEATRQQAFTAYFPTVNAAGMAFTTNRGVLTHSFDIPIPDLGLGALGLQLPKSLDFDVHLLKKGWTGGLNLTQPIFAGGRIVNTNRLAEVGHQVSTLQQSQTADQVSLTVEQYYWQLATLKAQKTTLQTVMALLDTIRNNVELAFEAGVTTRNEVLQVDLRRNSMAASQVDLDNGISLCRRVLAQYVGASAPEIDIDACISMDSVPQIQPGTYVEPSAALSSTDSYQLLQQNVEAARLQERIAMGKNLPTVGAGAGWFYEHLLDQTHGFGALYLTVNVPISDWWGGSRDMRRRKVERSMAENTLTDGSELLQIKMQSTWDNLTAAQRKAAIAHESIGQSKENLRINRVFFDAGTSTISDLLDAQSLYLKACDDFIAAVGNFHIAHLQYLQSTGR